MAEFSYDSVGNPSQFVFSAIPPLTTHIEKPAESTLNVFPKPARQNIWIEAQKGSLLEVLSIDGQTVLSEKLERDITKLNCRFWPKGVYFVKTTKGHMVNVEKISLQ